MSAYGPLTLVGGRHGAPFGRELLVYLRQILHRDISLRGRTSSTGLVTPRLETKRRETLKRCCFSSLAVCADRARDRRETPYR